MEENFATRLKLFIDSINVSTTQAADFCDIPRPSFSQLLSGRNQKVSDIQIGKIHKAYPELSVMWLMFGEGPMLQSEQKTDEEIAEESKRASHESQKFQDSPTTGTVGTGYSNVSGLTQAPISPNNNIYQQLEENKKILELQMQIEKLQKNPRRVAQITVYYDDSTFETFVPVKQWYDNFVYSIIYTGILYKLQNPFIADIICI